MPSSFEDIYLKLRTSELRVYSDNVVKNLPLLYDAQLLKNSGIVREWKVRSRSTKKLISYLKSRQSNSILEVGCGNGWLSNRLAAAFPYGNVLAIDINETELLQAQRVFGGHPNLRFELAEVFDQPFGDKKFDCIVLAGTIQYFADLQKLISTLFLALAPDGEIHLIDSPIYNITEIDEAKGRSKAYFDKCGCSDMKIYYHHHSWGELGAFNYCIHYDPRSMWHRLGQKINHGTPFPWVILK